MKSWVRDMVKVSEVVSFESSFPKFISVHEIFLYPRLWLFSCSYLGIKSKYKSKISLRVLLSEGKLIGVGHQSQYYSSISCCICICPSVLMLAQDVSLLSLGRNLQL